MTISLRCQLQETVTFIILLDNVIPFHFFARRRNKNSDV